jgi:hypothetical protein
MSPSQCGVVAAVLHEISGDNNVVVLDGALEGIVAASACDDLALLWTRLPTDPPAHVPGLVAEAIHACQSKEAYSLHWARTHDVRLDLQAVARDAERSRCR